PEIKDVVSSIESLLTLEEDNQGDDEAQADGQEEEADEATDSEESAEQGAEDEADEADAEEPEADEEEDAQPEPAGQKFTVKIDGKDETVTRDELIAGYSRQSDYTRKTQALANERKTFEQEQAQTRQERAEYQALLPQLR